MMMVSGNVPNMPELFQSVRFLTTAVASEMSYSSGLQRQALFSIALVLYLFILLINASFSTCCSRGGRSNEPENPNLVQRRKAYGIVMQTLKCCATWFTVALVVFSSSMS